MISIATVLVFSIVLFFYLHIQFHLKTSNDLEVYELDTPSKATLEEVCDLRQPARLSFQAGQLTERLRIAADTYGAFDVKVRNCRAHIDEDEDPYVPLRLDQATIVMDSDNDGRYFTEGNADFLAETGLVKSYRAEDPFLRPYMVASCRYDYIAGSKGAQTPLRHELSNRTYFVVVSGTARIKLAPPKTSRYLYPVSDYCNYEFRSPINPWAPQPQYQGDFDKVKCLDVVIKPGSAFFLPAKWWYSIEFSEPRTRLAVCRYSTYMSTLATSPHLAMWALQTQNVQHRIAAKIDHGDAQHKATGIDVDCPQNSVTSVHNGSHRDESGSGEQAESRAPDPGPPHKPVGGQPPDPELGSRREAAHSATKRRAPAATVATSSVSVSAVAS